MTRALLLGGGGQNTHKLCAAIKRKSARGVKYWAEILGRLASSGMKNDENGGKTGKQR